MLFVLFLVVIGVLYQVVTKYNGLQGAAHEVREAHANVMASMKKRIDLMNKLIDIAKGYADHEKLTHIAVANAGDEAAIGGAGMMATSALTQVLKLATQYPDLKANAAYQQLMVQLQEIEGDLQNKREVYNGRVRRYNTALGKLPVSLYAKQLGFSAAPYFDVDNADSLDRLKDFHSDDADHLKEMLAQGSRKLADGGRKLAEESVRIGKFAVEKGMELQQKHATDGVAPPPMASEAHASIRDDAPAAPENPVQS